MSGKSGNEDYQPEFKNDEEKDQFIRGVMICQVWAKVVKEDAGEIAELAESNDEIAEEYQKLLEGEDNEFSLRMADHFGLPYTHSKNGIKLHSPYGKRYEKAWVELGVKPSMAEKIANAVTLGVLSDER